MSELLAISLPLKGDVLCAGTPGPVSVAGGKTVLSFSVHEFPTVYINIKSDARLLSMEAENYLIIEAYSYKGKRQGKVLMPLIQGPSFTEPDFRALKDAHFGCFV